MLNFFLSSAPADKVFKEAFINHLSSLRRAKKIEIWSESEIMPGAVWKTVTKQQLQQADIIVLLLSDDFMASDEIWDNELRESLERRAKGEAVMLLPILVRPCIIKHTVLENIQGLPRDGRAVSQYGDPDEAWYKIAVEIDHLTENFASIVASSRQKTASAPPIQTQQIIGSKNVISGSVIIVGGNLIIGDQGQ
jgi:hypothetical protein